MNIQAIVRYLDQGCKPKGSGVYAIVILPPGSCVPFQPIAEFQVINLGEFKRGSYDPARAVIIDAAGVTCGEMNQFLKNQREAILIPGNLGEEELFEEFMAKRAAAVAASV